MKSWMIRMVALGYSLMLLYGCANYVGKESGLACLSLADCNPSKDCGQMVRCIDAKCDPEQITYLPCGQGCSTTNDCPEGMHCRLRAGQPGLCVVDGSCESVVECWHLEHTLCLGSFECREGRCHYGCMDDCLEDGDCVLAFDSCGCGAGQLTDFLALRRDRLEDWMNRPECRGLECDRGCYRCDYGQETLCWYEQGGCIRSVCQLEGGAGQCGVQSADLFACGADSECVKVEAGLGDCCGCSAGGGELAMNRELETAYEQDMSRYCSWQGPVGCDDVFLCTDRYAACREGGCTLVEMSCNCPPLWDPVCVTTAEGFKTLPNECQANCLGLAWHYHGDCDCLGDCGPADPVCATNGVTYYCGEWEVACNGQSVHYPGECNPNCDFCDMLARPTIPACGEDFRDYPDMCFAECQGLYWWHAGDCWPGEGQMCGGIAAIQCSNDQLHCLLDASCPQCTDPPGVCIALGHCLEPVHCEGQPIPTPGCVGHWECANHACTWVCD